MHGLKTKLTVHNAFFIVIVMYNSNGKKRTLDTPSEILVTLFCSYKQLKVNRRGGIKDKKTF